MRYLILTATLCFVAPGAFAQGYERTLPQTAASAPKALQLQSDYSDTGPNQKLATCADVVVTQQLQTLLLLTQQLQATGQIVTTQADILRAVQRLEAGQHPVGASK